MAGAGLVGLLARHAGLLLIQQTQKCTCRPDDEHDPDADLVPLFDLALVVLVAVLVLVRVALVLSRVTILVKFGPAYSNFRVGHAPRKFVPLLFVGIPPVTL